MNTYNEFAFLYDTLMDNVDYEDWFLYIKKILNRYDKKPKNVLEMACGTGSMTKYIAEEFLSVTCFDLSEEMLSVAYDKLRPFRNVKILNQDMVDLNLNKKFEFILCACDGLNYVVEDDDLYKTFVNVYDHLEDDGLFVFDINSFYKLKNIIGKNTFVEDREDIFYVWDNYFDNDSNVCEFYLTFFVKDGEIYKRFDEKHIQRAYDCEEILHLLKKAGFNKIDMYESFAFDKPKDNSERINFVVKK